MLTERFFSVRQIEEHFAPRLSGMSRSEVRRYLDGFCKDHKVICGGSVYTADDLFNLLAKPDFDPTHGLEYLGF